MILVSVTPRHFMLLVAIVKHDVSLVSFSTNVSSVNGRGTMPEVVYQL